MIEVNDHVGSPRSVASSRILTALAVENGVPIRSCLVGTGLTEDDLADSATLIGADQELRIIGNIVRELRDPPALGLTAGMRYHFTSLGVVGLALASSDTLGDAMTTALRYIDLTFALTRVSLEQEASECRVVLHADETPIEVRRFALERSVGVLFTLARDLFGSVLLCKRVAFDFEAPSRDASARYRELLGIEPRFGERRTEIALDAAELARPLVQASPVARELAEAYCEKLMSERRSRVGFAERVRGRIARRRGRLPDMDDVAADLGLSPRTLRRRLRDEGTTYSALCEEVRETFAEELLVMPDLSIEQVADRLGYADATSFIAAFKRWKGCTPSRYRSDVAKR